jgi:GNAT superfamily N-acetyltransferase
MLDDWYRQIRLRIPFKRWELLPRFPGYKSEYFDGEAIWSPRPRGYHAILDLGEFVVDPASAQMTVPGGWHGKVTIRSLEEQDWKVMAPAMANAFHRIPPFCSLTDSERIEAAEDCLKHTRRGGDGELLPGACTVAANADAGIVGALLVTRWKRETGDCESLENASPNDAHITWIFVQFHSAGHGVGSAMLARTVISLREMGFKRLYTTFMAGNESSMLWHWRSGFRLLPYLGSYREIRRQIERRER